MVVARANQLCSVSKTAHRRQGQSLPSVGCSGKIWFNRPVHGSRSESAARPRGPVGPCRGYGPCFAVDLCSGTGRAVLTHEHSRHPDAHALQRTYLRGSVSHTGSVLVTAAQRVFCTGRDAAAVVGRSVRQHDEQMPRRRTGRILQKVACGPQSKAVTVPAGSKISVDVLQVLSAKPLSTRSTV